jgi:hypothetical protein
MNSNNSLERSGRGSLNPAQMYLTMDRLGDCSNQGHLGSQGALWTPNGYPERQEWLLGGEAGADCLVLKHLKRLSLMSSMNLARFDRLPQFAAFAIPGRLAN